MRNGLFLGFGGAIIPNFLLAPEAAWKADGDAELLVGLPLDEVFLHAVEPLKRDKRKRNVE